ncbi:transglycosylase domain-containing protein [Phaeobacter inhibens]|uniref:transglycosylase domain-containing protein n=1 Tax=Phaeobacter inhibens TaxID=221822 RepID=UPI000C9B0D30|nr:transglycosylase domain-containing protein [Phaeobacter inhibens]AUQ62975.1 penicillin-binding protein 1A MrcA [Phaeobacter inhibens]AUQ82879.1 penicillin-binding protein 1A MrcA [Phaeobacter inhibens]AUQ90640.1 penicillin-binding protein 1A MrcA [Phaeobacter inhibens]MDO6758451.1 transglycosylase domain-containing protein [Phaeobacter inhibens]
MRALLHLLPSIFMIIVAASAARGDNTAPELPSPDHIRDHYQESATNWPTIPRTALMAFVAAEDRRFFEKPPQISTITQQIGRWYPQPGKGKLQRVALSFVIGEALTHDEVLNWYVNQIFLGQTCFGLPSAAMAYFGKPVEDLRLEEIAYLAALPKAPMLFHPVRSYDRAVERRNFVLSEMLKGGFISEHEAESAINTALVVIQPLEPCEPEE